MKKEPLALVAIVSCIVGIQVGLLISCLLASTPSPTTPASAHALYLELRDAEIQRHAQAMGGEK